MADNECIIIDPVGLSAFSIGQPGGDSETNEPAPVALQTPRNVRLVLLQPLADAEMLAACHGPFKQAVYKEDEVIVGPAEFEYLDLKPLSAAWRRAVAQVAPFTQVTFDLSLPRRGDDASGDNEKFGEVRWDMGLPDRRGIAVVTQDVCAMVNLLALNMRMRTRGDLAFKLIYDVGEGVRERAMKLLESQLCGLETRKKMKAKE